MLAPCTIESAAVESDIENPRPTGTVSVNAWVTSLTPIPIACTTSGYTAGTATPAKMVTVAVVTEPEVCTLETVAVTPDSAPVTVKFTVPVKPPIRVSVAVTVCELPCSTVALVSDRDSAMLPRFVTPSSVELQPTATAVLIRTRPCRIKCMGRMDILPR